MILIIVYSNIANLQMLMRFECCQIPTLSLSVLMAKLVSNIDLYL
uniref:Uncharacterized protein n=1 Tax=Rhizophora mucronata TaxID=61149 RepID=A0A2P2PQR2_RHIMU